MLIQGEVGPQVVKKSMADLSHPPFRVGNMGALITAELHGRYYEAAYRGTVYSAANSAGVTTTVGTAATYVGICLSNPLGSGYNLVLNKVGYSFLVAFTAASALGVMVGFNGQTNVTHTTPLVTRSTFVGAPAGVGLVDSSATLPSTPALAMMLGSGLTGAITTLPQAGPTLVDLEGSIVLPPGGFAAFHTSTASGASGFFGSFFWEEVPV